MLLAAECIGVTVHLGVLRLNPGDRAEVTVQVQNLGPEVDVFTIAVEGLDTAWHQLSVSSTALFPGDSTVSVLTFNPPRSSATGAGAYPFHLTVTSQQDPSRRVSRSGRLVVEPFYWLEAALTPEGAVGAGADYRLSLHNHGNTRLVLEPTGTDRNRYLQFHFDPELPAVPPGEGAAVVVRVRAGWRPLVGATRRHEFTLDLRPAGAAAAGRTLSGALAVTHPIPVSSWVVLLLLTLGGIAGVLVWQLVRASGI